MQFKRLIIFTYAITAAGLAMGLASNYTRAVDQYYNQAFKTPAPVERMLPATTTIVTAMRPLPAGHKLSRADFELAKWPVDSVPRGAFRSIDDVLSAGGERIVQTAMVAGEVLLRDKLAAPGSGSALSMMLPRDMRAVTIQINEVLGVGGFVRPNDHVDILLTELSTEGTAAKAPPRATRVILQNVKVLAMGQEIAASRNAATVAKSATVAVTLEGAQKLALATTIGRISFALRNPLQKVAERQREISLKDLQPVAGAPTQTSGKMEVVVHRAGVALPGQATRTVFRYGGN